MSKQRAKGTAFESAVVAYLQADGWPAAERRAQAGSLDRGDISGLPFVVIECKHTGVMQMGPAVAEAEKERKNAKARFACVVFKRRQHSAADAYCVTSLAEYSQLLSIAKSHGWLD